MTAMTVTIHPLAWLIGLVALLALAVVGLCQISRADARRRRQEDLLFREHVRRAFGEVEDEWREQGIGRSGPLEPRR